MKKLQKIFTNIMTELYENSEPTASWDVLLKTSPKDEMDRILIPFEDHKIDRKLAQIIFDTNISKKKLSRRDISQLNFSVWLGPSPKFKIEE